MKRALALFLILLVGLSSVYSQKQKIRISTSLEDTLYINSVLTMTGGVAGQVLVKQSDGSLKFGNAASGGATYGANESISGYGLYSQKVDSVLKFKRLSTGSGITIDSSVSGVLTVAVAADVVREGLANDFTDKQTITVNAGAGALALSVVNSSLTGNVAKFQTGSSGVGTYAVYGSNTNIGLGGWFTSLFGTALQTESAQGSSIISYISSSIRFSVNPTYSYFRDSLVLGSKLKVVGKVELLDSLYVSAGISGPGTLITALNASNIASGTLSWTRLPTSGASAGSYTNSDITVNSQGIITDISNGTSYGGSGALNYSGSGIPSPSLGVNGDSYWDTTGLMSWIKLGDTWRQQP